VALAVVLVPVSYIVVRATDQGWSTFHATFWRRRTFDLVVRSAGLGITVTAVSLVVGIGAAWLVASTDVPGRGLWRALLATPLALPSYVAAWAWIGWRPSLAGFTGAVIVLSSISYPYVYLPVLGALHRTDPALAEVARACGRGPLAVFVSITLRQLRVPALGGAILVMLYSLSEFGGVAIMRYETLTYVIYHSYRASFDRTPAAVLGCVLVAVTIVPLVLAVWSSERARVARVGGGSARRPAVIRLGVWRWPACLALAAVVGISLGVPAWNLLRWIERGSSRAVWSDVLDAGLSTVWLAALAAGATLLLAFPLGVMSVRHPGRFSRTITSVAYAGHTLPGITIALSLVFFGIRYLPGFYQRTPMLIGGYVVLFLSLAVGAVQASIAQIPRGLDDVARAAGRTQWGVWRSVTIPLATPGLGAAATLVFIAAAKELPATLLLRPIGVDTLATRLWTMTDAAAYAAAAPYAAALVVVAVLPTLLLTRAGRLDRP